MSGWHKLLAAVVGLLVALLLAWGGVGFFGPQHYKTTVVVLGQSSATTSPVPSKTSTSTSTPGPTSSIPSSTPSAPATPQAQPLSCPSDQPGPVKYYANDPAAARYHSFGVPLARGLSPLYEPRSTPQPDANDVVRTSWSRLCQDPALARAVVAAAYPQWGGLRTSFDWPAALKLLTQGEWSAASVVYYAKLPTRWTMAMYATGSGPPRTLITHTPYGGWFLKVRFGDHEQLLRLGCGDQPVLDVQGYHRPLLALFQRA